jgi:hypothetical protein
MRFGRELSHPIRAVLYWLLVKMVSSLLRLLVLGGDGIPSHVSYRPSLGFASISRSRQS